MTSHNSTVAALVQGTLRRYDTQEAILNEDGGPSVTFGQLRDRVYRLAHTLTGGLGLRKGDALGVLSQNRAEYIELDFACAMTGIVKVPFYARNAPPEHVHVIDDARIVAMVGENDLLGPLSVELGEDWGHMKGRVLGFSGLGSGVEVRGVASYEEMLGDAASTPPDISHILPSDIYQIRYTGGTTGKPKGATHDHAGMLVATWGNVLFHGYEDAVTPRDVVGHIIPFSHASAFNIAGHSWTGARHLPIRAWDPERYVRLCETHGISINLVVPTMINALLEIEDVVRNHDMSSMRTMAYGAAPISQTELTRALELFGPVMTQGYGGTETPSLICWLPKREHDPNSHLIKSCGYAAAWADIEIHRDDDTVCDFGEVGEVCIKSPSVMVEYNNQPEATADAKRNGWYHSGDIGVMDEQGYVYLQDRKRDMIISGGFNIYPAEVENAIMSHPDVLECAVVGMPDPKWGDAVSALIRPRDGRRLSIEEVQEHCRKQIGSYKKPVNVRFTDDPLPQSEIGKVLRREVRELLARDLASAE